LSADPSEVVTLGESMVVFIPEGAGPLRHADRFTRAVAGAESNVAIGVRRLGHSVSWISRVGEDEFGRHVLSTLRGEGVDVGRAVVDPSAPTGIMFKERRVGADSRAFYYRAGSAASHLDADDVAEEAFRGARWLHLTGITPALGPAPRRAVRRALEFARRHGLRVSFDPNYRERLWPMEEARPVLRELACRSDVLLLGAAEGRVLYGTEDAAGIARAALEEGIPFGAVKLGALGALIWDGPDRAEIAAHAVPAIEPTGAGDAFAAGCIAGRLDGRAAPDCGRLGAICGALACTVLGDWEGAPERETAERLLAPVEG